MKSHPCISPVHLRLAARHVHQGGLIAYPTEAVYGLGCDPWSEAAVLRLLELKNRPMEKGLILIAADIIQLEPFVDFDALNEAQRDAVLNTWPGPHTWLMPVRPHTPRWLRGRHETLAVRVTAHPLAAALCRATGSALVSTSANPATRPPARSAFGVRMMFGERVDYIVPGRCGPSLKPTEIRDARSGNLVRPG